MVFQGIQVWGDSVLKGVVFDPARNRYSIIKQNAVALIGETLGIQIKNCSRMGRTAPEGLRAIEEQDQAGFRDQLVVVEYGGNDCDLQWAQVAESPEREHEAKTPLDQFEESLDSIVRLLRDAGATPVLCTLPPLDARRYFDWITRDGLSRERILAFLGAPERIYRWQELYSNIVLRISSRLNCACLPLREAFLENVRGEDVLCVDGIHPNDAGHALIARYASLYRAVALNEAATATF